MPALLPFLLISAAVADPPQPAPTDRVCRRVPPAAGTIMPRRVCKTRAEWQAEDRQIEASQLTRRPAAAGVRPGN